MYILIVVIVAAILLGLKFDFIVLDRNVFYFQVSHIIKRQRINNLREYRAMHNYIEMLFERDPDSFETNPKLRLLNKMMGDYDSANS